MGGPSDVAVGRASGNPSGKGVAGDALNTFLFFSEAQETAHLFHCTHFHLLCHFDPFHFYQDMPPRRKRERQGQAPAQAPPPPPPLPPRHMEIIDVDEETWDIRQRDIDLFDPPTEYENKPGMFAAALHHGGGVVKDTYVGGSMTHFDNCLVGQFQLLDLSSMLLKLGYPRDYICEFYYCDPRYNDECKGTTVGRRVVTLVDECRMGKFLSLALSKERLLHVYVVEITATLARAKLVVDQKKNYLGFYEI